MVLKGSIDEIRYKNEENGYTIAVLDVEGEPVVCVGTLPPVSEGENLSLEGEFIMHPRFGRQFKISKAESAAPDTLDGVVRYLGSGLIAGVGPKTALAIVSHFGKKTLEVIEFAPYMLTKVKGISRAKADVIHDGYAAVKAMRDAVIFLQSNNITAATAVKIYKNYGDSTEAVIKTNPYKLIDDVEGIGFLKADKIALSVGIKKDSPFRICAGIIHTLKSSGEKEGNTFLPRAQLICEASELLELAEKLIEENIETLIISAKLKRITCDDTEGLMLAAAYRAERGSAHRLSALVEQSNRIYLSSDDEIAEYERSSGITLHSAQKEAVRCAVKSGVSVITGGPGTGKTTILKCILSVLDAHKLTYTLMAPTGRAAKRMSESTGKEASTIHRALMLTPNSKSDGGEMTTADVIIVDEFSMVDIYLFYSLVSKIKEGSKLIIVGDKDQLPSVGAGNVLKDILDSGYIPTVNLTEVYRQSKESLININAHAINKGQMPELKSNDADFFFVSAKTQEKMAELICDLASERIPKYLNCDPSKIQVLSPVKNGMAGTINLNALLQERLNSGQKQFIQSEEQKLKTGDRVMHTANNYSLEWTKTSGYYNERGEGVFNGDLGYISDIRSENGEVDVLFEDGRLATYSRDILSQLILAYAVTVHKSQGSEFDAVIMPVHSGNYKILTRNLLYTAITRAKKIVILVGEEYNIKKMVDNNYIAKRYSMLKSFISEAKEKYGMLFGESGDDFNE